MRRDRLRYLHRLWRRCYIVVIVVLVAVNVIDARVVHASLVIGPAGAAGFLAIAR